MNPIPRYETTTYRLVGNEALLSRETEDSSLIAGVRLDRLKEAFDDLSSGDISLEQIDIAPADSEQLEWTSMTGFRAAQSLVRARMAHGLVRVTGKQISTRLKGDRQLAFELNQTDLAAVFVDWK